MAIDQVLCQAAATIVAGRIQARATKATTGITITSPAVSSELSEAYEEVLKAVQLIEDRQAKKPQPKSSIQFS